MSVRRSQQGETRETCASRLHLPLAETTEPSAPLTLSAALYLTLTLITELRCEPKG